MPHDTITARDITAALRMLYPNARPSTTANPDGTFTVRMPAASARYWGIGRDNAYAAAWLTWHLPEPVDITKVEWTRTAQWHGAIITVTRASAWPEDPRSSAGMPAYLSVHDVLGDQFAATRPVRLLISAAIDAGLCPHIDPQPSPHGPGRYRVIVCGLAEDSLFGAIDVHGETGRFAEAWLTPGNTGREIRYGQGTFAQVRAQIYTARKLAKAAAS